MVTLAVEEALDRIVAVARRAQANPPVGVMTRREKNARASRDLTYDDLGAAADVVDVDRLSDEDWGEVLGPS